MTVQTPKQTAEYFIKEIVQNTVKQNTGTIHFVRGANFSPILSTAKVYTKTKSNLFPENCNLGLSVFVTWDYQCHGLGLGNI